MSKLKILINNAEKLKEAGIGSMSLNTLLVYNEIYARFRLHKKFVKSKKAVELTAIDACCSEETVWRALGLMKRINLLSK